MGGLLGRRGVRAALEAVAVIAAYYVIPIQADRDLGPRLALSAVTLLVLGVIVTRHVRRGNDPLDRLFILLLIAIATISLAFFGAASTPGQFVGLETRTDALYFTIVTMATIGYGDIHATGQFARVLVMIAVLFRFTFLTALISTITRRLRVRDADDS